MRRLHVASAILAALMILSANPGIGYAATPSEDAYTAFNKLRASGANENSIYSSLHECFKTSLNQLNASQPGSEQQTAAIKTLVNIYPFLKTGAFYFSNNNNQNNALVFACAYIDASMHPATRNLLTARDEQYATLAYFAASGLYNRGSKTMAIPYFRAYLESGDQKHRKDVMAYMAKACIESGDKNTALDLLSQGVSAYPNDFNMLSQAINCCIEMGDNERLQIFVTKALAVKPEDETLLNIQGKLYEDTQQFQKALATYVKMQKKKPNNLQISKHVALNYYNLGAANYNKSVIDDNASSSKRFKAQAYEYFEAAVPYLEAIVASDPSSVNYMQALASVYSCLDANTKLDEVNGKLALLGASRIERNSIPQMMSFAGAPGSYTASSGSNAGNVTASPSASQYSNTAANYGAANNSGISTDAENMPRYSEFAKKYVEDKITAWQNKDPYETVSEYQARVTEATRDAKVAALLKEAEQEYINKYTKGVRLKNMKLKPYDAENEVFMVESDYGELVIPVPRANDEARVFESGWAGVQFKNPEYYINEDRLLLSSLTLVTPTGKQYKYDVDKSINYTETVVDMSFAKIDDSLFAAKQLGQGGNRVNVTTNKVSVGTPQSDVDKDIPTSKIVNENMFAVIIANENYSMVAPVPMALNDGEIFSKYCKTTLGMPENNIRVYKDASYGVMLKAVREIKEIAQAFDGDIGIIFYYAGHGIPNENTKDAYLLPVDGDGIGTDACYSLNKLYTELGDMNARSTLVLLDACFSGAGREGDMLASARGVALKPKKEDPKGNMIVFSASSDNETAFPYQEKGHGLFTYFLLKKLKESGGNVTIGELSDYVSKNVRQQSVVVNHKAQNPSINPSASVLGTWQNMKINKL